MGEAVVACQVVVHGRVQGVFFRATTRDQARAHGVVGWVRNRDDGAVEAWLEGRRRDVDAVLNWIHAGGPRHARVDRVEVEAQDAIGHRRFAVRR